MAEWLKTVVKIETSNEEFYRLFRRALEDMAALRLPIKGTDHVVFLPAAGLPWFVAPFGRDSLIVSLQNILIYPEFARGALEILGSLQAKEEDPYRDAEPGKILHELRYGELAHFKLIPHTPYYGTADATPLYLITLHAAWRATGDRELLERHLQTAEGCLAWIDKYGDRDGDGFQEYQTRSSVGYENMAWKDSGDAVMYPDGSLVKGPKALCELQGYVYNAWVRMAEVFDALGKPERAQELRAKAAALFARFNEAFWDEELGFYAYALDGDKNKVLTVASNAGHCLWSGIVPPARAKRVVDRLMAPDMWTGWGIRTLSADHPAFNPYNYQTGSVWPHDNAIIAMGFKLYGFGAEAAQIAHDVSVAASHFLLNQLPELYTASERNETNFPVQYLGANVPQAWAAGSAFMLTQALLGFLPDAPRDKLYVDPFLPAWLPDLTVRNLRIGKHKVDIRFWREGERTAFEVIQGRPQAGGTLRARVQDRATEDCIRSGRKMNTVTTITPKAAVTAATTLPGHRAPPATLTIFGAGGDLTKRLVVPALYNLVRAGKLPDDFAIIGVDHADLTTERVVPAPDRDDASPRERRRARAPSRGDRPAGLVMAHPSHALYAWRLYAARNL